jgi:RimJ/RimL family protein N-acetyltransferase
MYPLSSDAFGRIEPLIPPASEAGHMAFCWSLLNGSMPGEIFVDDPGSPRTALVLNHGGFWHAIGEPRPDLVSAFIPEIIANHLAPWPAALWSSTDAWANALDPLFAKHDERIEFHFSGESLAPGTPPDGYQLEPLNAGIASRFEGAVDPWVIEIWGGPEAFSRNAFGFALMSGDSLKSFCTACAIGGPDGAVEAEIEIGTSEDHRQRGLATIVGAAFIAECRRRGLQPAWTCSVTNTPSERLALRLGFRPFRRVRGYPLHEGMRLVDGRWQ